MEGAISKSPSTRYQGRYGGQREDERSRLATLLKFPLALTLICCHDTISQQRPFAALADWGVIIRGGRPCAARRHNAGGNQHYKTE
jgi:hypothetical protein